MKNYILAAVIIAIIAGVYFTGYYSGKAKTEVKYLEKEKLIHDTTITKETIFKNLPGKISYVFITDTLIQKEPIKVQVAQTDTLVTKDSSTIKVSYYFPPVNKFDVVAKIRERQTHIVELREVERPETFWDRFGSSIQVGLGYGWFNKNIDVYTGIGFYFKIN